MLLFHIFNTETIDRSIVSYYLTGNVTLFRGILMPCPDWIKVLYLFGTLRLHRLLAKTLAISKFHKFQNFQQISKFLKLNNFFFKAHNFKIFIKF